MQTELWRWSATDLAEGIRSKQVSSREVVQAHLDRIEAVNGQINAVTVVLGEAALELADEADKAVAGGAELGPLHGVPMTVKENIDLVGSATTEGVLALQEAVPPVDAPQVTQLKQAGAIPIGRTNLPDFGLRWHTDNALRGATLNPWDATLTPGGSSGGEAAALATGLTPLGLGNDYGGSLRWPSQCNGTTAIRPTFGRVPFASALAPVEMAITIQLFAVQGPMARHARDLRLALNAMCGPDPRDPNWVPAPWPGPTLPQPLKVAVTIDPGGRGVDPAVAAGIKQAAQALVEAGYAVEEVDPPLVVEALELWANLVLCEIHNRVLPMIEPLASADALTFLDLVSSLYPTWDLPAYIDGLAERNRMAREWSLFQTQYPLVLGPISTSPPFAVGHDIAGQEQVGEIVNSLRLVTTVNLLGLPAVATPVQVVDGLPQGVQIIAPRYREDLCLDATEAIEQRVGVLTPIDPKG